MINPQHYDMTPEMQAEAIELITMAIDKHVTSKNYEAAATMVKNTFDKKFGTHWHCAIGEGFGFEITYQQKHLIFMYYGQLAILCYKI